ncbi:MAG: permease-like cell division protein FtsX [Myxococcota bacterium]
MIAFILKQTANSIAKNPIAMLLSVFSAGVTFSLAIFALWAHLSLEELKDRTGMNASLTVLLSPSASAEEVDRLRDFASAKPFVSAVKLITAKEALKTLKAELGDSVHILDDLEENPLPDTVEITLDANQSGVDSAANLASEILSLPGVIDVQPAAGVQKAFARLSDIVTLISYLILALIFIVTVAIIGGGVRLNMLSYRKRLIVTSLLGATPAQLRLPFIAEGVFISIVGSIVALGLYYLALNQFLDYLNSALFAIGVNATIAPLPYPLLAVILCALWLTSGIISYIVVGRIETPE